MAMYKFNVGDYVQETAGRFKGVVTGVYLNSKSSTCYTVEEDDGTTHAVYEGHLETVQQDTLAVGDRVRVKTHASPAATKTGTITEITGHGDIGVRYDTPLDGGIYSFSHGWFTYNELEKLQPASGVAAAEEDYVHPPHYCGNHRVPKAILTTFQDHCSICDKKLDN